MKWRHHITTIWSRRNSLIFGLLLLTACSPARLFYYPNNKMYVDPDRLKIDCEVVRYKTKNGRELVGLWFESDGESRGTVVHLHGNFGNVSMHFLCSYFLVKNGFDVLVVDYQGYGGSQGKPSPKGTIEDGLASIDYALARDRSHRGNVLLFGQSLGAAVATVVAAKDTRVAAVVLEAGFHSYRGIARDVLKRSAWTWILYPFYPWFLGTTYDPQKWIAKISPRPVLLIHGGSDKIVPPWTSEKLYARAKEPKRLIIIPNTGHLQCREKDRGDYEKQIVEFFLKATPA